jgi:hypothetical protein
LLRTCTGTAQRADLEKTRVDDPAAPFDDWMTPTGLGAGKGNQAAGLVVLFQAVGSLAFCASASFRSCRDDAGCPPPGDRCELRRRECRGTATETDGITSPLVRTGRVGPMTTLVAAFCVPPGTTAVGNVGLGLPAAASLRLPVAVETTTTCAAAGGAAR